MSGEKYNNRKLKRYFKRNIKKLPVKKEYRAMLVEILMRRADTYDLSKEDIKQDMESLLYNLKDISIDQMPDEYKYSYGLYYHTEKKILISEKMVKNSEDDKVFQTITHEVYHALSKDKYGRDRLGGYNTITGQYNSSLLEAIVEKSSYRAVFGNDKQNNIYYNNSARGYGDIIFIVDVLEATYGVSEQEFLKNGIMGRERLAEFLSTRSGETPQSAYMFLDSIEANYALLHRALYPLPGEKLTQYQQALNMESALTGIYNLCESKMSERISRAQVESFEDVDNLNDELKYDHNKLSTIMGERLQFFSKYYANELSNNVYSRVYNTRSTTLKQINDIGSLVEAAPNFSDESNFLRAYEWASSGSLDRSPTETRTYYGINLKLDYMLPMTREIVDRAFYDEKFGPQYNNSKISKLFKKSDKGILKTGIDRIRSLFSRKDQKLLTHGTMPQEMQSESMEASNIFPQPTKEQQEQYNNQVRQAVENLDKSQTQEEVSKEIDSEEK